MSEKKGFKVDKEDLDIFLAETDELLANTEENLVELEKSPSDSALVQEIFRAMHTIKGGAATLGLEDGVEVTHAMESILDQVRSGTRNVTRDLVDMLFLALDWLRDWRNAIGSGEEAPNSQTVMKEAQKFQDVPGPDHLHEGAPVSSPESRIGTAASLGRVLEYEDNRVYVLTVRFSSDAPLLSVRCFQVLTLLEEVAEIMHSEPSLEDIENDRASETLKVYLTSQDEGKEALRVAESVQDVKEVKLERYQDIDSSHGLSLLQGSDLPQDPDSLPGKLRNQGQEGPVSTESDSQSPKEVKGDDVPQRRVQIGKTIRVDVRLLDFLLNTVGELVIDRTRLTQIALRLLKGRDTAAIGNEIAVLASHLQRTSAELQEGIMRARLLPLKSIFTKFPRMMRDLTNRCGKAIEFSMEGEDTELDRTVIEAVDDPLIHILRNAVDHGIESPEERVSAGKPKVGSITLAAWHEENQVFIRVKDDGKGIDVEKLKSSAVKKGLLGEDDAARLSEREALELIFIPGFSTVERPTEVSGRGVGLDVVRANLERINGQVDIRTWPGKGTWVTLRLPLTLAIMRALLVQCGELVYAIPTFSVEEVVALRPEDQRTIHGKPAMVVRDKVFPLISLGKALWNSTWSVSHRERFALLTRSRDEPLALAVDDLLGEEEIVVKEMGRILSRLKGVAGATILAQGDPAVILDVTRLL